MEEVQEHSTSVGKVSHKHTEKYTRVKSLFAHGEKKLNMYTLTHTSDVYFVYPALFVYCTTT